MHLRANPFLDDTCMIAKKDNIRCPPIAQRGLRLEKSNFYRISLITVLAFKITLDLLFSLMAAKGINIQEEFRSKINSYEPRGRSIAHPQDGTSDHMAPERYTHLGTHRPLAK